MILPGACIGILGGGQLGRMTGLAARHMGYGIAVLEPTPRSPAAQIADTVIEAAYDDLDGVRRLARAADVVTYEFENIAIEAAREAAGIVPTHPRPEILHICQNRAREKQFLADNGFPCAPFAIVDSAAALREALPAVGGAPAVLKTADFGYDGKGQQKIAETPEDFEALWREFGAPRGVLEGFVDFALELSVIVAANPAGEVRPFPVAENIHTNHILDFSIVPARVPPDVARAAVELASDIARSLQLVGLLAVEMFLTRDGRVLVNEMAPRPHNSGHWSLDGACTSQFEQHVRAVCGLPLGDPSALKPTVMLNLLGDLWHRGTPDWSACLSDPHAKLHLYGKAEARPGRKMGHLNILADSADDALARARAIKARLLRAAGLGDA
ncbi:MAG: 5-(carboxyamino)imidazole ribonucleotide synthase [Verrucomicrobia bacterium]|nr:MAG: 5-(carboxyamino)imidazole ribonucleotide synthase [Verrucomicrobiota bacterium]